MRKLLTVFFVMLVALSSVLPALAVPTNPQDFGDVMTQTDVVPGSSHPEWPEHHVYDDLYVDAMSPGAHYFTWYAPPVLFSAANTAMARWNAEKPFSVDGAQYTNNQATANLEFISGSCPNHPEAPGCLKVTNWTTVGGFNVNLWVKAKIYIIPDNTYLDGVVEPFRWTATGLTAALVHESGHAWGLGEQYTSTGSCNSNSFSVMDGVQNTLHVDPNGNYREISPCDTEFVQPMDKVRFGYYFIGGGYDHRGYISGVGAFTSYWHDAAWMDWVPKILYHWSPGPSGPWTNFAYDSYTIDSHGSAKYVPHPPAAIVLDSTINPGNWNIHQKYIMACSKQIFNNDGSEADYRCATTAIWWP